MCEVCGHVHRGETCGAPIVERFRTGGIGQGCPWVHRESICLCNPRIYELSFGRPPAKRFTVSLAADATERAEADAQLPTTLVARIAFLEGSDGVIPTADAARFLREAVSEIATRPEGVQVVGEPLALMPAENCECARLTPPRPDGSVEHTDACYMIGSEGIIAAWRARKAQQLCGVAAFQDVANRIEEWIGSPASRTRLLLCNITTEHTALLDDTIRVLRSLREPVVEGSPALLDDRAGAFSAEDAAKVVDEWTCAYSNQVFTPVPAELKAKDAVAADLLREMLPRLAADIRARIVATAANDGEGRPRVPRAETDDAVTIFVDDVRLLKEIAQRGIDHPGDIGWYNYHPTPLTLMAIANQLEAGLRSRSPQTGSTEGSR